MTWTGFQEVLQEGRGAVIPTPLKEVTKHVTNLVTSLVTSQEL